MGKDKVYAVIKEKYPEFEMKYYTNTILTQENLEKYGVDLLFTLASTVDWEARNILQDGVDSGEIVPKGLEDKVRQEDVSVFSQEIKDFIYNKDGILQDYAYFSQNREWGLLGYWEPSKHIKVLQHVKENRTIENYKKVEELVQKASYLQFEPTSCLLLSDEAIQLFDGETIAELSNRIQSVVQNQHEKISIEEFDTLFKDSPEKLAVLFSRDFQDRIFGRTYDFPRKQREQITSEEVDKLYKEYSEIITKFPQDLLKILTPISYGRVYDQLVRANKEGLLQDTSMIENWNSLRKQMPSFVPLRWYLLSNEFVKKYSAQELSEFSKDDILIKRLDQYGLPLLRLLKIEDIQKQEEKIEDSNVSLDPRDEILGGSYEYDDQEEYSIVKFAEDLLNNDQIRELVSSFRGSKKGPCLGDIVEKLYMRYKSVARNNHNSQTLESLGEIEEIFRKAKKFEEVARFIPALHVLLKYAEDQIEKFDKKKWAGLVKYNLYSKDNNSKWALIEAVLSLGVFEKDEEAKKRYGLLQKFATYLPKEINVNSYDLADYLENFGSDARELLDKNFQITSEENIEESLRYVLKEEKLLSDPTFIRMFGDKETATRKLMDWRLLQSMSPEQMERVLNEPYTLEERQSLLGSKEIIQYIYQNGYEKVYAKRYHFTLKTDLQALIGKKPKEGHILEQKIRQMYQQLNISNMMIADKMHRIFDGMDMRYKPGFYDFFVNNLGTILANEATQKMLSKIQKQWEKIEESFLGQKITFDMCQSYFANMEYDNMQPEDLELAKLSINCGYDQNKFEAVAEIYHEQLKRTTSSIPPIWEDSSSKEGYTYQVLRLDDPTTIFVGELTNCCQAIGDAGESCMIHSATSSNGRMLVVKDEKGRVTSQSWIWRNKNVLCFDNVEAVQRENDHRRVISNEILNTIQRAAEEFVRVDTERFEEWRQAKLAELTKQRKQGDISEQEFETQKARIEEILNSQRLTKVTVGQGYSDISLKGLQPDDENRYPEEKVEYIADSRKQFVLYEDTLAKDISKTSTTYQTIPLYEDPEELQKLIGIDTSELEPRDWNIGNNWTDDVLLEDDDIYDTEFVIAKEEVERFVRDFLNNTTRQEAQEFLTEMMHSLERNQMSK